MLPWEVIYPILDFAFVDASDQLIRNLRLTNSIVRHYVDCLLAQHIVYVLEPRAIYSHRARIRLPHNNPYLAARVRVLDILPGQAKGRSPASETHTFFPKVQYARIYARRCEEVADSIVGSHPNLTVIYFAIDVPGNRRFAVGNRNLRAGSAIVLLPVDKVKLAGPSTSTSPRRLAEGKAVFAFMKRNLQGTNMESAYVYCNGLNVLYTFHPLGAQAEIALTGASRPSIVGLIAGAALARLRVEFYPTDATKFTRTEKFGEVWRVKWSEWMEGLTKEERMLIESIPELPEVGSVLSLSPFTSAAPAM